MDTTETRSGSASAAPAGSPDYLAVDGEDDEAWEPPTLSLDDPAAGFGGTHFSAPSASCPGIGDCDGQIFDSGYISEISKPLSVDPGRIDQRLTSGIIGSNNGTSVDGDLAPRSTLRIKHEPFTGSGEALQYYDSNAKGRRLTSTPGAHAEVATHRRDLSPLRSDILTGESKNQTKREEESVQFTARRTDIEDIIVAHSLNGEISKTARPEEDESDVLFDEQSTEIEELFPAPRDISQELTNQQIQEEKISKRLQDFDFRELEEEDWFSFAADDIPSNMFIDVNQEMFVGREQEFAKLSMMLQRDRIVGISGMGGVGKTTFSSLYAYKNLKQYQNGVFFVDASNISTLPYNFAQLAGPDMLKLVPRPEEDVDTSMRLAYQWLSRNSDYLLIYDAADDEAILARLGKQNPTSHRYLPPRAATGGHVIITSRCPREKFDLVQVMQPLLLEDLSVEDACVFLWRRVYYDEQVDPQEMSVLRTLVQDFLPGRLPLYLEQTASHIRGQNLSFGEYLDDAKRQRERYPVGSAAFGDNRKTVDDAFTANFDAVGRSSPEAACLLNMAAVCHSRNIPMALYSVGALALERSGRQPEAATKPLIDYLLEEMEPESNVGWQDVFRRALTAGRRPMRRLLAVPWQSQLVKAPRGSDTFTVHEVIQEQLRLRMKRRGELVPTLKTVATALLHMLRSDDVSLAGKQSFLSHADACAKYMGRTEPFRTTSKTTAIKQEQLDNEEDPPERELYLRLRIKTAFVFAWLGSFPTAWEVIAQLEKDVLAVRSKQIKAEFCGLKARICVWQHRPAEAVQHSLQGLELLDFAELLGRSVTDDIMEYALMSKSCAHALICLHETDGEDVQRHLSEAKCIIQNLMKTTRINCQEEYAHLLMLYGLLHRNNGYRCRQDKAYSRAELTEALRWLRACLPKMSPENYFIDTCKVHIVMIEISLETKSRPEAIEELLQCREDLERKLGRYHRYTAWVMEKTAQVQMESGRAADALQLIRESLRIQEQVYSMKDGKIQRGGTMLGAAKALLELKQPEEALEILTEAEELLKHTPKHPALFEVRDNIKMAKEMTREQ